MNNTSTFIFVFIVLISIIRTSGQSDSSPTLPSTCIISCQAEYTAFYTAWNAAYTAWIANPTSQEAQQAYYNAICTDPSYPNLIKCLLNNCAGTTWTDDLTSSWASFESDCAANGHSISNGIGSVINGISSTGSGGGIITPPITTSTGGSSTTTGTNSGQCVTQCDPIAQQVSTELSGITAGDYAHLCTSSVPSLYNCLTTYCVTDAVSAQAYNTAYNGFANVCRAHGYNVAGATQGTSNAHYNIHFSSIILTAIGSLSLLAIKFA
jgi:hypothetical protein